MVCIAPCYKIAIIDIHSIKITDIVGFIKNNL